MSVTAGERGAWPRSEHLSYRSVGDPPPDKANRKIGRAKQIPQCLQSPAFVSSQAKKLTWVI